MKVTTEQVEAIAPDQKSLTAASKLLKMNKWPEIAQSQDGMIWGACQGSGANPYLVVADTQDLWYKCTCPSRKFPCKHALALFWLYAQDASRFADDRELPDWAVQAIGRRRKKGKSETDKERSSDPSKNIAKASTGAQERPKKKKAPSKSKQAATLASAMEASQELEGWISDQMRSGFSVLLKDPVSHCRRIAARLVDRKASVLAGRVDELPSLLLGLPNEQRPDALIAEFSKWVLLCRAFRANPDREDLRREIVRSESRDDLLENPDAPRILSQWEVIGAQNKSRRDGLIQQGSWLLNLDPASKTRVALLLDFFPASSGRRNHAFQDGEQFRAQLCFYPGSLLQRAVIVERQSVQELMPWPSQDAVDLQDPLHPWSLALMQRPWSEHALVQLQAGRVVNQNKRGWWISKDKKTTLPLSECVSFNQEAVEYRALWGIWNGFALDPIRLLETKECN